MLHTLQHDNDPTMMTSGTEEKREKIQRYQNGYKEARVLAANEAIHHLGRDPDLNSEEIANICNNALSFQGTQALIRGRDGFEAKLDRLSAMFHVAICQEDNKVGKRSRLENAGDAYCWGEMFGPPLAIKSRGLMGASMRRCCSVTVVSSVTGSCGMLSLMGTAMPSMSATTPSTAGESKNVPCFALFPRLYVQAEFTQTTGKSKWGFLQSR